MTSYRIVRRKYADLRGEGARLYGGRYNKPGTPAVYTSQSIALALLEVLVHIDKLEVPMDYVVMSIRFAGRNVSGPRKLETPRAGRQTIRRPEPAGDPPILRVPSVIVPRESNYVLFPDAIGFEATVNWIEALDFDNRLFAFTGQ